MKSKILVCSIALAACAAVAVPALMPASYAQGVKERWLIDSPDPNDPAQIKKAAEEKKAEEAAQAKTGAGGGSADAPVGSKNEHGLVVVKNPYTGNAKAIAEGKELFVSKACSGCHGAGGGGGMCPAVINDIWVYGSDDTTLFNLVKLGSVGLQGTGYTRVGHETVVGEMPPFASIITEDEEWKLIAYVRSKYAGDPSGKNW